MVRNFKYRYKLFRLLIPYTKGVKRYYALAFFLSFLIWMLSFAIPQLYSLFVDKVILEARLDLFVWVLFGYLLAEIARISLDYIKLYANNQLTYRVLMRVKLDFWRKFATKNFSYYESHGVGETYAQLEDDTRQISKFTSSQTIDYIFAFFMVLGTFVMLLFIDWRLSIFSLTIIPLAICLDLKIAKKENVYNEEMRNNNQQLASWLHSCVHGWREVKALNQQDNMKKQFALFTKRYGIIYAKRIRFWALRVLILPIIRYELLMQFGLYFIGGLLIMNGELKISELLVFSVYHEMFSNALKTISNTDADLEAHKPHTDRLISGMTNAPDDRQQIAPDDSNLIEFKNVTFSYAADSEPLIKNFSACIHKGEKVAIVGRSGSGKTTLLKLMMGLIHPSSGNVLFGNVDLNKIDSEKMYSRIGFVMQENMLFNMTIRDNLTYGKISASLQEIIDACKKACIYDFISSLPDAFDTVIGEQGVKLSGGQRQRLALARVFLREPEVLVLDEATSALDQYSENLIQDAVRNIGGGRTVIVVSHRESSIQFCDRKIWLQ